VALRSGVLRGHDAFLYAGSGVVAKSDATAELAETELKLASLLDALRAE
jgi:menaquinone-specific isochorismate synthase